MKAYSEDLRRKIVDAIGRGMPKAEAARTFAIGISTLKRYATKARRGEPLEPCPAPGKRPKMDERAGKLLEEDLKERPFATLRERCEYVKIEEAFSKIKGILRRAGARTKEALLEVLGEALSAVSARDAGGYFEHAGYRPQAQVL